MTIELHYESSDQTILEDYKIAVAYCEEKGDGWTVVAELGRGGTATVFKVETPGGDRAFKVFSKKYSVGTKGIESEKRITKQIELGDHNCPYLIKTFDGGRLGSRLFLLMECASGNELAKQLAYVPREKILTIVEQVAQACIFLRERGLCHRDIKSAKEAI